MLYYAYFYLIMSIIVTDIEFNVARMTDGVDAPSVINTATRTDFVLICATRPWLTLN